RYCMNKSSEEACAGRNLEERRNVILSISLIITSGLEISKLTFDSKISGIIIYELLIIQKEFSGFKDTNERLDLLALDKQGNLVVIGNKLDDSGREVAWQVLKYASYCSSLSTEDITQIYNSYLGDNTAR